MKVAIPITAGTEMSDHFGRSPAFLILSLENGQIQHRELRANVEAGQLESILGEGCGGGAHQPCVP